MIETLERFTDPLVWRILRQGIWVTLQLTFFSVLLGTAMSIIGGLAGMSPFWIVRAIRQVYVDIFRGTSAIVQLFWIFYALPILLDVSLSPMLAGVVTLGLNMGAYGSEIVRGAVRAVDRGQTEAAIALNLSSYDRMRYVIFPQAVVAMLPPYGNLLIELLKATALVSLIALSDIVWRAQQLRTAGATDTLTIFTLVLLIYFAIALGITGLVRLAERTVSRGLEVGSGARGAR